MARKTAEAPKDEGEDKKSTAVAIAKFGDDAQLPADFAGEVEGIASLGYSQRAEDSLIPIVSILQDNSGEVKKGHSRKIEGAEAGFLIIRAIGKVIDLSKGLPPFQPCGFQHVWVGWLGEPGEGVVTGQYPFDDVPKDAKKQMVPRDNGDPVETWIMPDGSRLVDTRYHYGQIYLEDIGWMAVVLPMAGTNHTVSRGWTNLMKTFRLPNGSPAPSWFRGYSLNAKFNQKGQQSWYNYEVKDLGWIADKATRDAGRKIMESLEANTISANVAAENQSGRGEVDKTIPV